MTTPDADALSVLTDPVAAAKRHDEMANAIRALAMDAVEAANSGHPGMPMGMADVATVLFTKFLKFDCDTPEWPDRDRFVLSAGHGSMLLYALLHLTGYPDMTMAEIRNFRQLGSRTPGHPEFSHAPGIETTTGPLGQGLGNAVGMALAERLLNARYGDDVVDHYTYVLAGDGCLMEGISHEALSLAGHLKLSKLIVLFDDNRITIDGATDLSTSDDVLARIDAYGFHTVRIDGHDAAAAEEAIAEARESDRPSLIACRTTIGFGAPNKQGTASTHGAPLGEEEVAAARETLGWPAGPFVVPDEILAAWRKIGQNGGPVREAWQKRVAALPKDKRNEFTRVIDGTLPERLDAALNDFKKSLVQEPPTIATRKASQNVLEVINDAVPETIGGSADLTGSNNTLTKGMGIVTAEDFAGRFVHYGVREHGMAAVMNGLALHRGVIPYSGTFLVFSDYCRPSIRLSALMGQRVIYVMTHDSIGLGEDGPTHQPVEHLASLRAMPNVQVFRPADAVETAECWQLALHETNAPSVLALTRQNLAPVRTAHSDDNLCAYGAYELLPADGEPRVTLIATGSEVGIAVEARSRLADIGVVARVVSMPSWERFEKQDAAYRRATLRPDTLRVAIEAGATTGWERYVGEHGAVMGLHTFGASAPYKDLYEHFGLTPDAVVKTVRERLGV